MNRRSMWVLIGGLAACLGVSGDGCLVMSDLVTLGRRSPAIIATNPAEPTLSRTFEVDLRAYPEVNRIAWEFGDDAQLTNLPVASGRIVTHSYSRNGTYTVVVHLFGPSDLFGQGGRLLASGSLPVDLVGPNASPEAVFVARDVTDDSGNVVALAKQFDASRSRDPDGLVSSYAWDFGDGSSGSGLVVEHTFSRSGRYEVRLSLADDDGATSQETRTILVEVRPAARFAVTRDTSNSRTFTFDASASTDPLGAVTGYAWDFGDGTVPGSGQVATHTYGVAGDYDIVLTVTNDAGVGASAATRILSLVRLTTTSGDVVIEFVDDAPVTTANFLQYVDDGFFDGTIFHRVVSGFVVQGGGFLPGMVRQDGVRDPIVNEFSAARSNLRETLAMAKLPSDPNSATSEFFFNLADNSGTLDGQNGGFTVFARVIVGMDVVDAIAAVAVQDNGQGEVSQPVTDVLLISATRE